MTKWIVGNWKMYGEPQMARSLAQAVVQAAARAPQQPCFARLEQKLVAEDPNHLPASRGCPGP